MEKSFESRASSDDERERPAGDVELSPSVASAVEKAMREGGVTAHDLLASLARTHPTYAERRLERARDLTATAPDLTVYGSMAELLAALGPMVSVSELHTRAAVLGIAALEPVIGRELDRLGVLDALERELAAHPSGDTIDHVLSATGLQRYRRMRARQGLQPHTDQPADVDELERWSFAELLATRLQHLRTTLGDRASYMLLLHGDWGSGKSSVLRFLQQQLRGDPAAPWVVVEFNAWRHRHRRPPWWSLIREIYQQARPQLRGGDQAQRRPAGTMSARALERSWLLWHVRTAWLPALLALTSLLLLLVLAVYLLGSVALDDLLRGVQGWITLLLLLAGTGWAWFLGYRRWLLGSARASELYDELRHDPTAPLTQLFDRLTRATAPRLAVLIDDLDRCDTGVVVELLEGIQTLFRGAPVTYVVAADQEWIRTAFADTYEAFGAAAHEPGRPLGHLFLEKLFQEVVALPPPETSVGERYWRRLLTRPVSTSPTGEPTRAPVAADAEPDGVAAERAERLEAAKHYVTPAAEQEVAHALEPFSRFIELNPRSMKRLVNALGLTRAVAILQGLKVPEETLARWCILEMRWPLVAAGLRRDPTLLGLVGSPPAEHELEDALRDPALAELIAGKGVEGATPWNEATLRQLWPRSNASSDASARRRAAEATVA
jgi:hypothetical protein